MAGVRPRRWPRRWPRMIGSVAGSSGWPPESETPGMQRRVLNGIAAVFVVAVVVAIAVSAVGAFTGGGTRATGPVETGVVRVSIKGLAFSRGTRTVAVGTTVVW